MRDVSRGTGLLVLVGCLAIVAMALMGCTGKSAPGGGAGIPSKLAQTAVNGIPAAETSAVASVAEAKQLLAEFNQPEEASDPGYQLLGPDHNNIAHWTRNAVLEHTDYAGMVSSLVSQQSATQASALTVFGRVLASKGATATYDSVISSEWRVQDDKATKDDKALVTLIPASTALGVLFDRRGRLLDTFEPKELTVSGMVAEATYTKPGATDVVLKFAIGRDAAGALRVTAWNNYAQFKTALKGNEIVDGMP